ncbi:hypothetical protein Q6322_29690, partial [Klebsiella pneumoniae]|uniref:hypothetical protein n=1 Tax=Klebsiella pneumoniae TaxID=573 RepID=UPI002730107B
MISHLRLHPIPHHQLNLIPYPPKTSTGNPPQKIISLSNKNLINIDEIHGNNGAVTHALSCPSTSDLHFPLHEIVGSEVDEDESPS